VGRLVDHLKSPRFTDADGKPTGPERMTMVVAPGGAVYGAWEVWRGRAPSARGLIDRFRSR
jgi:hypothetical protein